MVFVMDRGTRKNVTDDRVFSREMLPKATRMVNCLNLSDDQVNSEVSAVSRSEYVVFFNCKPHL